MTCGRSSDHAVGIGQREGPQIDLAAEIHHEPGAGSRLRPAVCRWRPGSPRPARRAVGASPAVMPGKPQRKRQKCQTSRLKCHESSLRAPDTTLGNAGLTETYRRGDCPGICVSFPRRACHRAGPAVSRRCSRSSTPVVPRSDLRQARQRPLSPSVKEGGDRAWRVLKQTAPSGAPRRLTAGGPSRGLCSGPSDRMARRHCLRISRGP